MINEVWGFFCIVGFWGWVLCTIGLIIKSFPRRDAFAGRPAFFWGTGIIASYCLWVAGMLNS